MSVFIFVPSCVSGFSAIFCSFFYYMESKEILRLNQNAESPFG